jgi:maltooligosyltrehalose trehalohydrolase
VPHPTATPEHTEPVSLRRRLPVGAEFIDGRTHFRVWAPAVDTVDVVLVSGQQIRLLPEGQGYFSGSAGAKPGDRYLLKLGNAEQLYPDPCSRLQPEGPHKASQIVDPLAYRWRDAGWPGVALKGQVIYELHTGTFTPEGTWTAAATQLPELRRLGVTVIELMPVAEFDGRFGWGYDGVDLFAPSHLYGTPDDLRRFVDTAHVNGLGVILDVVYNHLGPAGNYLRAFAPAYFTNRYDNEWGDAINFDGDDSAPVREFFLANAAYWIDEFHFDGLRLDATQQIYDSSSRHIVTEIGEAVRRHAQRRQTMVIAENEAQDTRLVQPAAAGGHGLDAVWNDDFHHSAMVALHGRAEAYYSDTRGEAQELISAAKYGYLFQGQWYGWQQKARGTPAFGVPPAAFVTYLQNHDQIANSACGRRGHEVTSAGKWRAMTALMLLAPGTPMLFQGQEFSATAPFLYFADFDDALNAAVRKGRAEFLTQFPSVKDYVKHASLADPSDPATFHRCKLNFEERETNAAAYRLHQDLLRLRRETAAFSGQRPSALDGAVLSPFAFVLRFFDSPAGDDRILVVNLGPDVRRPSFAEPLLAPPQERSWHVEWSSEDPRYGGCGTPDVQPGGPWHIPAECALVFAPGEAISLPTAPVRRRTA